MKYRILVITVLAISCLAAIGRLQNLTSRSESTSEKEIEVAVSTPKKSYALGEVIPLAIMIRNLSGKDISMVNTFDQTRNTLKLYVYNADKSLNYQKLNPALGFISFNGWVNMRPGEKLERSLQVLARKKPDDNVEFLFDAAGTYYLQVSYRVQFARPQAPRTEVKSEPIKINITEPHDQDMLVWETIKDRGEFAYFMQEGDFLISSFKKEERAKLQAEIEQILAEHPNSIYAGPMRESLEKYKAKYKPNEKK